MKLITEYLEHSVHFERMAAAPENAAIKEQLKQADDYRKLAEKRAAQLGLPLPPPEGAEVTDLFCSLRRKTPGPTAGVTSPCEVGPRHAPSLGLAEGPSGLETVPRTKLGPRECARGHARLVRVSVEPQVSLLIELRPSTFALVPEK
jgi:hypothetical protein